MKPISVGLVGLGTVAQGTLNVLAKNREELTRRVGREIQITHVGARRDRDHRPVEQIRQQQWFNEEFIQKKRSMLARCVQSRQQQAITADGRSYSWPHADDGERQFRFPPEDFGWT